MTGTIHDFVLCFVPCVQSVKVVKSFRNRRAYTKREVKVEEAKKVDKEQGS